MKIVVGTKEEISKIVSEEIIKEIQDKPNLVLGLATGSSPIEVYANLVKAVKNGKVSFKDVTTFNLDEYVGLDERDINSYRYFMKEHLFNHIDINKENINFPSPDALEEYDKKIEECGNVDLQILGVGRNGHIGFNEPFTSFNSTTHLVDLSYKTRQDNSRFFYDIDNVPKQAVTIGLKNIMNAKKIILMAFGESKQEAIYKMVKGQVTKEVPCSILQEHSNCTIYVDEEAYNLLKTKTEGE